MRTNIQKNLGKRAQVFSIDVLFSLLPIMMIIGASLQYLYLSEEQMKGLSENSYLETLVQGMAENTISADPQPPLRETNCRELSDLLRNYPLPSGYVYHVRAVSYIDGIKRCHNPDDNIQGDENRLWSNLLPVGPRSENAPEFFKNTMASELRFMLESDDSGNPEPGRIAGVSFIVWEDKP